MENQNDFPFKNVVSEAILMTKIVIILLICHNQAAAVSTDQLVRDTLSQPDSLALNTDRWPTVGLACQGRYNTIHSGCKQNA